MTITEAAAALRSGKTTSVALASAAFDTDPGGESAPQRHPNLDGRERAAARPRKPMRNWRSGHRSGTAARHPDRSEGLIRHRGVGTTGGSKLFANCVPDYNDAVVEKLHAAGAVVVGKPACTNSLTASPRTIRITAQCGTRATRNAFPADRAADRPRRSPQAWRSWPWAAIPAAPSGSPRLICGVTGMKPTSAASANMA